jgi:hypothetical protein
LPLTHQYTLLCDDVRVENSGKLILIGMYTPHVGVPQIPFAFSALTFLQAFSSDRVGHYQFRGRLQHVETGRDLAQAMGMINVVQVGMAIHVLRFGNLVLDRIGAYHFILNVDGQPDPILHSFDVFLQPVQPQITGR